MLNVKLLNKSIFFNMESKTRTSIIGVHFWAFLVSWTESQASPIQTPQYFLRCSSTFILLWLGAEFSRASLAPKLGWYRFQFFQKNHSKPDTSCTHCIYDPDKSIHFVWKALSSARAPQKHSLWSITDFNCNIIQNRIQKVRLSRLLVLNARPKHADLRAYSRGKALDHFTEDIRNMEA